LRQFDQLRRRKENKRRKEKIISDKKIANAYNILN